MTWQIYRWVWQVRSPVHIGLTPAGALHRTRLYIPARTIWGAVAAEAVRRKHSNDFPDYKIGRGLLKQVRFSYLYPAEEVTGEWKAWLPKYGESDGLVWQREDDQTRQVLDRAFRLRLLDTRASTAISSDSDTAEEGSLHEVECVQPNWRTDPGKQRPVGYVGYVLFENSAPNAWNGVISEIGELFVGGETRYGFGRLFRRNYEPVHAIFGFAIQPNGQDPIIQVPKDKPILAHADSSLEKVRGDRECLFFWDYHEPKCQSALWWQPGSQFEGEPSFVIQNDGRWTVV